MWFFLVILVEDAFQPPICASAYKPGGLASRFGNTNSSVGNVTSTTSRPLRRFQRDAKQNLNVQIKDFEPVDGDFQSQYLYVLESTENPEKGTVYLLNWVAY